MTTNDTAASTGEQGYHAVAYVPLNEIVEADANPKSHDRDLLIRMIKKFGVGELPLRDERTGRLVAGHGRLEALQQMHAQQAPAPAGVRVLDDGRWAMPMLTGWRSESDDHARAYLLGSNQSTTVGGWDDRQLAEMLRDVEDVHLLDVTGFAEGDIDVLEASLNDGHPYGANGGDEGELLGLRTVVVNCRNEADQTAVLQSCLERGWDAAAVSR